MVRTARSDPMGGWGWRWPLVVCLLLACVPTVEAQAPLPPYLLDRGTGTPTSMFGTYNRGGELLVYLFAEYYRNRDAEYSPTELGQTLDEDFRGDFRQTEYLVFLGYGISEDVAIEFESVLYTEASLKTDPSDPTAVPDEITESGLGDTQVQINWRWKRETADSPELFSFLEIVFPLQKDKQIIGTGDWEYKLGIGAVSGYDWGTLTWRIAAEYDRAEGTTDFGEYAVEYLKRVSEAWRMYAGIEGNQDEIELILEAQRHLSERTFLKFNSGFGLTSKAVDYAPEVGVMMSF